jgi:caffeoyl-CoA O-methyltransferase
MSIEEKDKDVERVRALVNRELEVRFAPEDAALRSCIARADAGKLPAAQISPLFGKFLHLLALTCGARKILEIGSMAGYSGIWLARSLPADGKLLSLEVNPEYAALAQANFAEAGLSKQTEVRVGAALDILPTLQSEAPFDLIFIDADKVNNPIYLDWAIILSRPGSLIIADNIVRHGRVFQTPPPDDSSLGAAAYNRKIIEHPKLVSVAFPIDDLNNGVDGFSISLVRP